MPLIKSGSKSAISQNIREFHTGDTYAHTEAKFGKERANKQAIAAALSNARRYGAHMDGGGVTPPFGERMAARSLLHQGFIHSAVPGRTDKLPISVKGGAYVLPADHVAAVGQGNSLAGANIVNKMFKMGPYGTSAGGLHPAKTNFPKPPKPGQVGTLARGGDVGDRTVPIIAAGGEIVIPPENIKERFGDVDKGHKALDQWVINTRKKHIKTLRKLKPPRKD